MKQSHMRQIYWSDTKIALVARINVHYYSKVEKEKFSNFGQDFNELEYITKISQSSMRPITIRNSWTEVVLFSKFQAQAISFVIFCINWEFLSEYCSLMSKILSMKFYGISKMNQLVEPGRFCWASNTFAWIKYLI